MMWRVFGGGVALLGILGLVLALAALFGGKSAAAPVGLFGLLLLALGLRLAMVPPEPRLGPPPGTRYSPTAIGPLGAPYAGTADVGNHGSSDDCGGGSWGGGSDGGGGWSGGGGDGGGGGSS